MTTAQPQRRSRRPRWRPQFTLAWLLGVIVVANLYFAYFLHEPAKRDRLRLHVTADAVVVGRERASWNELPSVLKRHAGRFHELDIALMDVRVALTVDEDAACRQFLQVVKACRDVGFWRIELRPDEETDWYHIATLDDLRAYRHLPSLPPFTLELRANDRGDLFEIETPFSVLGQSELTKKVAFPRIRQLVTDFIGPGSGPDSIRETATLELTCDEPLRFKHFATLLRTLTEEPTRGTLRVPLIRKLALPGDIVDELEPELEFLPSLDLKDARTLDPLKSPRDPITIDIERPAEPSPSGSQLPHPIPE